MKILLYSSGLGYIRRGLESFTFELYSNLKKGVKDIILYKGMGDNIDGAVSILSIKRNSKIYEYIPFKYFKKYSLLIENCIFSIPIVISVLTKGKSIIFFSETDTANILLRLRRLFNLDIVLIFSNGGPGHPSWYGKYDYIHVLTPAQFIEATKHGISQDRLFMLPYGIDVDKYSKDFDTDLLRNKYRLPKGKKIILSVGAINMYHKRMDWLIKEFSYLNKEQYFLWIVGQVEEETDAVLTYAFDVLPHDSYCFSTLDYNDIHEAYLCSDIFILCSLNEGFGRVYLEAMSSNLFILAHRNENTEYILGSENIGLIDMSVNMAIKEIIESTSSEKISQIACENFRRVSSLFSWEVLRDKYITIFELVDKKGD